MIESDSNALTGADHANASIEQPRNLISEAEQTVPAVIYGVGELLLHYQQIIRDNKILKLKIEQMTGGTRDPTEDIPVLPASVRELLSFTRAYARQQNAAATFMVDIVEKHIKDRKMAAQQAMRPSNPVQQGSSRRYRGGAPTAAVAGGGGGMAPMMPVPPPPPLPAAAATVVPYSVMPPAPNIALASSYNINRPPAGNLPPPQRQQQQQQPQQPPPGYSRPAVFDLLDTVPPPAGPSSNLYNNGSSQHHWKR